MDPLAPYLLSGVDNALEGLAVRGLPVVVAFAMAERCPAVQRIGASLLYTAIAYLALNYSHFRSIPLVVAYAYFATACSLFYVISKNRPARLALFGLSLFLFLLLPGLTRLVSGLTLALGWELTLATYSFGAEASPEETFSDYLFFIFVNPSLVYSRRGKTVALPGLHGQSIRRAFGGAIAMVTSGVITSIRVDMFAVHGMGLPYGLFADALRLTEFYLAFLGLAAIRIGLVRQLGYQAPECYLHPIRSLSPREFWSRWNTYVGRWGKLYIFQPLARRLRPYLAVRGRIRRVTLNGALVVVTFGAIGGLHDVYMTLSKREVSFLATGWFAANALILLAWELVVSFIPRAYLSGRIHRAGAHVLVVVLAMMFAGIFK